LREFFPFCSAAVGPCGFTRSFFSCPDYPLPGKARRNPPLTKHADFPIALQGTESVLAPPPLKAYFNYPVSHRELFLRTPLRSIRRSCFAYIFFHDHPLFKLPSFHDAPHAKIHYCGFTIIKKHGTGIRFSPMLPTSLSLFPPESLRKKWLFPIPGTPFIQVSLIDCSRSPTRSSLPLSFAPSTTPSRSRRYLNSPAEMGASFTHGSHSPHSFALVAHPFACTTKAGLGTLRGQYCLSRATFPFLIFGTIAVLNKRWCLCCD